MDIRVATQTDHPQILELAPQLRHGVAPWRDEDAVRRAVTEWVETSLAADDPNRVVLVAADADTVLGFVSVAAGKHWSDEVDAIIGELVVDPRHRRKGIGRALVSAAISWADDHGIAQVSVATGARNEQALRLYEQVGFEPEDVTLSRPTRLTARREG